MPDASRCPCCGGLPGENHGCTWGQTDGVLSTCEAGDRVQVNRADVERAIEALHAAKVDAIAFYSDEPYPDDPRWSPWTRFGKRTADKCDRAEKALREALDA